MEPQQAVKKTYQAPQLVVHGTVSELTGFEFGELGLPDPRKHGGLSTHKGS